MCVASDANTLAAGRTIRIVSRFVNGSTMGAGVAIYEIITSEFRHIYSGALMFQRQHN